MDRIITNDLNTDFLATAEGRGYKTYIDSMKARENASSPGFYLGSLQKRVTDESGTRYFINIDMFDLSAIPIPGAPRQLSARAWIQFHRRGDDGDVFDVSMAHKDFQETEAFFEKMWDLLELGYYERTE